MPEGQYAQKLRQAAIDHLGAKEAPHMANQSYKSALYHVKGATGDIERQKIRLMTAQANLPKKDETTRMEVKHVIKAFDEYQRQTEILINTLTTLTNAEPATDE